MIDKTFHISTVERVYYDMENEQNTYIWKVLE